MTGVSSSARGGAVLPTASSGAMAATPAAGMATAARGASRADGVSRVERNGARNANAGARGRSSLGAQVFGDVIAQLAAPHRLRPAAVRRQLEALQSELQRLQDEEPEDLFELALGALEDEIRNAERLQAVLQAAARR